MELQNIHEFDGPHLCGLYNLKIKLKGNKINDYKLFITVHDFLRSDKPENNYNKWCYFFLKFDKNKKIFYNEKGVVNKQFELFKCDKQNQNDLGLYSVINLNKYKYVFINGLWYQGDNNNLKQYISYTYHQ